MSARSKQDRVRELRDAAQNAVSDGKSKKAVGYYLELIELDPKEGDHGRRAADCYRLLGNRTEQFRLLLHAARAYSSTGQLLKAIAMGKLAKRVSPGDQNVDQILTQLAATSRLAAARVPGEVPTPHVALPDETLKGPAPKSAPPLRSIPPAIPVRKNQRESVKAALAGLPLRFPSAPASRRPHDSQEFPIPSAPCLEELELTERLRNPSLPDVSHGDVHGATASSRGAQLSIIPIDVDDLLIEELAPGSEHLSLDHLDDPDEPHTLESDERLRNTLGLAPLFRDLPEGAVARLIADVELVELERGDILFSEGDPADAMYVVAEGSVVAVRGDGDSAVPLAELREGDFFGEIGLLGKQPRQASIISSCKSQLLCFKSQAILALVEDEPKFLRALMSFLRERLVDGVMRTSPLFSPFGPSDQATLRRMFRFVEIEAGCALITEGEKADGLYVLLTGAAQALEGAGATVISPLEPGDVFGEMSLLKNQPAMASVVTTTKSYALRLPAQFFMEVLLTHPVLMEYVATLGATRELENQALQGPDEHIDLY